MPKRGHARTRAPAPEDESADPVGPVPTARAPARKITAQTGRVAKRPARRRVVNATSLARQESDFTSEGAPPPGVVAKTVNDPEMSWSVTTDA